MFTEKFNNSKNLESEREKKVQNTSESENYVNENLKNFKHVETKKISDLPYWGKIKNFLANKGIEDREIIVVDDNERWNEIYGSNNSKSSHKPEAIILKRGIFDKENISYESISWLIHEVGHIEFYKSLGEKLDEYMEKYHAEGKYSDSEMESSAFQLQFEFLKSVGKTKDECRDFIKHYLNKTFVKNEKEQKEKELKTIEEYLDNAFHS